MGWIIAGIVVLFVLQAVFFANGNKGSSRRRTCMTILRFVCLFLSAILMIWAMVDFCLIEGG